MSYIWLIVVALGPVLLASAYIYARTRRKTSVAEETAGGEATRELYRQSEKMISRNLRDGRAS